MARTALLCTVVGRNGNPDKQHGWSARVREELARLGWTETQLQQRRKGDKNKVRIARRLREETTVTLKWIAARLQMGVWTHVTNRLYQFQKKGALPL